MKLTQAMVKSVMNRLNHSSSLLLESFRQSLQEALIPRRMTDDEIMDALLDMGNDDLTDLCQRIMSGTAMECVSKNQDARREAFRLVDSTMEDFSLAHKEFLMNIEADLNFELFDGDPTDAYISELHKFTTTTLEDILHSCMTKE